MATQLFLIAAFGNQGQVGLKNDMPWYLPAEMKHFTSTTLNHCVIMGRNTFESIGHPLSNRRNIVISNKIAFIPGVEVVRSLEQAISLVRNESRAFIIGGVGLWTEALPYVRHLVLSEINYSGEADVTLPEAFFATIRGGFHIDYVRHQENFSASYWTKNRK